MSNLLFPFKLRSIFFCFNIVTHYTKFFVAIFKKLLSFNYSKRNHYWENKIFVHFFKFWSNKRKKSGLKLKCNIFEVATSSEVVAWFFLLKTCISVLQASTLSNCFHFKLYSRRSFEIFQTTSSVDHL